jgi:hypothetical protein
MPVDARDRMQRKRYIFDPEEGLCIVLARLSILGRWREMEKVLFRSAGACCETFYVILSTISELILITICAPQTL